MFFRVLCRFRFGRLLFKRFQEVLLEEIYLELCYSLSNNLEVRTIKSSLCIEYSQYHILSSLLSAVANDLYSANYNSCLFLQKCNPTFMKDIFAERDNYYSLRNINHLQLPKVRTTIYGTENIQYRGCFLWSSLPSCLRDCSTIQEFKRKIKQWNGDSCTCRLCRVFIKDLGFLD